MITIVEQINVSIITSNYGRLKEKDCTISHTGSENKKINIERARPGISG